MLLRFTIFSLSILAACALPTPERVDQDFIPDIEIKGAALVNEGMHYYKKSRYFEAESSLRKAQYLFPNADNIKASLAVVLQTNEQLDESVKLLKDLIKRNPEVVEYKLSLARIYYVEGKYNEATKWYKEALDIALKELDFARAANILRSLATLNFRVGNETSALCYSEEALILKADTEEFIKHVKAQIAFGFYEDVRDDIVDWMQAKNLMKDPSLLQRLSIITYALGDTPESVRLAELAKDLGLTDGTQKFELSLLEKITEDELASTEASEEEVELSEDEILQFRDQLEQVTQSPLTLYWPFAFLDKANNLADEMQVAEPEEKLT